MARNHGNIDIRPCTSLANKSNFDVGPSGAKQPRGSSIGTGGNAGGKGKSAVLQQHGGKGDLIGHGKNPLHGGKGIFGK
jgi:hypothetical protein